MLAPNSPKGGAAWTSTPSSSHCTYWWTTGGRLAMVGGPRRPGRPPCSRTRRCHPGHPGPVAPLPQREGLLALRFGAHLRPYFPQLCSQGQFNRRVRALEPELRALQRLSQELTDPSAVYRVMDTTLIPAIVRVRASRKGLFCGQATFGRTPPRPNRSTASRWPWWSILGASSPPSGSPRPPPTRGP